MTVIGTMAHCHIPKVGRAALSPPQIHILCNGGLKASRPTEAYVSSAVHFRWLWEADERCSPLPSRGHWDSPHPALRATLLQGEGFRAGKV